MTPDSVRCWPTSDPEYIRYHDEEWGRPVRDERGIYERLCLEGFQSGLSWLTILRKRPAFREAFAGFEPDRVAAFGEVDVTRLLGDAGIVRHRGKIEAAIANAGATVALRATGEPLDSLFWSHAPAAGPAPGTTADWKATTPESTALAKRLRAAGFQIRRPDDCVRGYASMRRGQRSSRRLLGSRRCRTGALVIDDRVRAVLRRLEAETEAEEGTDLGTDYRSLQVPPTSGAFLFALCWGRPGCEVLEIGGSRGYSTIWFGAAVRLHGGHVTSLEASPVKLEASARNIADAGLSEWIEVIPGDAFETLERLSGPYDVVFIDAWKDDYEALFRLARARVEPGAVVVADNVLSHSALAAYTAARQDDPGLVSVTIPMDNGLELTSVLTDGLLSD